MTFYLSRYVLNNDIKPGEFVDALREYLMVAVRDPSNNIAELDNCIESMLSNKILSERRPALGLMYNEPKQTTAILTSTYLLYLLFYSRVFQRKHDWEICYLSPISQHLLRQNVLNKLPSIYAKYGGEIDLNRQTIHVSTCDFFFMSFVCFPLKIGPLIPRLLTQIYSTHNLVEGGKSPSSSSSSSSSSLHESSTPSSSSASFWHQLFSAFTIATSSSGSNDTGAKLVLPDNPFKRMHHFYARIFNFYLQTFVPSNLTQLTSYPRHYASQQQQQQHVQWLQQQRFYSEYGLKFIEIIGELWFGQSFAQRPIGDRCHTLPLMQDLVFRIMEKQIDYQHQYVASHNGGNGNGSRSGSSGGGMHRSFDASMRDRLFALGAIPKSSCLCPELRVLLRYLYFFLRESFEHFPLDFIAHLRHVIEMWTYVLAPWTLAYKAKHVDKFLAQQKATERAILEQQQQQQNARGFGGVVVSALRKLFSFGNTSGGGGGGLADKSAAESGASAVEQSATQQHIHLMLHSLMRWNDDRERKLAYNNTQFSAADKLVAYELDAIDTSLDISVWRQYIIEMLPFYSTLVNYFVDALLKYDLGHPLKQLCVLKVLHVYKNEAVVAVVKQAENALFNPSGSSGDLSMAANLGGVGGGDVDVNNLSMDAFGSSEPVYVMNVIQEITYKRLSDYRCLPFLYTDTLQMQQHALQQQQHMHLYPQLQQPQFIDAQQMLTSIQLTRSNAYQLYIKCKKAMTRLCPPKPVVLHAIAEQQRTPNRDRDRNRASEQQQSEQEQAQKEEAEHVPVPEHSENIDNIVNNDNVIQNAIFYVLATVLSIIRSVFAYFSTSSRNTLNMSPTKTKMSKDLSNGGGGQYTSSMTYFATPQDNVRIIRYIVGELEELFLLSPQQQDDAMNVSIMYEPSQSPANEECETPTATTQQQQQQQYAGATTPRPRTPTDARLRYAYCQQRTVQLWNRPQGEWEWSYSLMLSRWLYHNLICRVEWLDHVYCAWLAKAHRTYLCDIRVMTWLAVLLVSKLFLHRILFYFIVLLFALVLMLSFMHRRGLYHV